MPVNTQKYTQLALFLNSVCFRTVTDHEIIIPRKLKVLIESCDRNENPTQQNKKKGRRILGDLSPGGGGGGGDSHMKGTGMLVVSLRGVNFGFWSRLGCSGQNVIIFSRRGLV